MAAEESGFDAVFVETVADRFLCPICFLVLREPKLTDCGHHFCANCFADLPLELESAVPARVEFYTSCPSCRAWLTESNIFSNNALKREILDLKIKCDQHEKGCKWVGELRYRETHENECEYVEETCENKCGEMVIRKEMKNHKEILCGRRVTSCDYCSVTMEWRDLTAHYLICLLHPVFCIYLCGQTLARGQMKDHTGRQGNCPNSILSCDFSDNGCQFEGKRHELLVHIESNTANHLSLIAKELRTTKLELENTKQKLEKSEQKLENTEQKLEKIEQNLEKTEQKLEKTEQKLEKTEQKLENTEQKLEKTEQKLETTSTEQKLAGTESRLSEVESQLCEELIRRKYSLPPVLTSSKFVHKWRIENWSEKVIQAKLEKPGENRIMSSSFYVYPGYHLYLGVFPVEAIDDDTSENYVGVYLFPSRGDFDKRLVWPFPLSFDLAIIDQQLAGDNVAILFSPPYEDALNPKMGTRRLGKARFVSHKRLESRHYIKDDSIICKLTIHMKN
ncbi:TNF receptor-associated factor 3-like [Corticium candelabrum]|uniref:TNF receptor-associated factor 3-like n=1 Tax=Corticium candelabrum TaxID=121492 RepID=UPI002E332FA3|nr:TNF receptor-associated factor 3-like [Corticium candelabrum]